MSFHAICLLLCAEHARKVRTAPEAYSYYLNLARMYAATLIAEGCEPCGS